jgi:hypothetical protein
MIDGTYRVGPSRVCRSGTVSTAICLAGNTRRGRQASCTGLPDKIKINKKYIFYLNKYYSINLINSLKLINFTP